MSSNFEVLSDKEIKIISELVRTLDESSFEFLQLEVNEIKLTIGKGAMPANLFSSESYLTRPAMTEATAYASSPSISMTLDQTAATTTKAVTHAVSAGADVNDGTVAIVSPIMGRFYCRPDPTAEPYIGVGSLVSLDTTVGLVEVMKLFNAVTAGVDGIVTEICVEDGQVVEHGQVLARVRSSA